jgi:hypothetical protein
MWDAAFAGSASRHPLFSASEKRGKWGLALGLAAWAFFGVLLIGDVAITFQFGGAFFIDLDIALPLCRDVVFRVNGFDRALGDAGFAVDAVIGVNVEHRIVLIEALDRANNATISVLAIVASFGDDVGHRGKIPFLKQVLGSRPAIIVVSNYHSLQACQDPEAKPSLRIGFPPPFQTTHLGWPR